ncbi:MAG: hypothetical protein ACO2PN_29210 [Pyrobaculum sp.]|jgi:hypothetical protein
MGNYYGWHLAERRWQRVAEGWRIWAEGLQEKWRVFVMKFIEHKSF